jgi:CheY-like chemotaxis protein
VVEQAAAWVLPEVAASHAAPAPQTPAQPEPPAGNGWFPAAAPTNGNGNGNGAHHDPTTLGWSGTPVPVEPAADFAVLSDATDVSAKRPWDTPVAPESPNLKVIDGAETWTIPAPAIAHPSTPSFDPAMFDTNDDTILDDLPATGEILLVEDDLTIAKLYRVLLESRGYAVRHACDGLDGLDKANEKRPDLVLLDIMMPRMNGIAFLQALRAGHMRDVPVVVLSNFMEKQLVDDAMSLGALEYMVKAQTRPEALVGALPHWLKGERAFTY